MNEGSRCSICWDNFTAEGEKKPFSLECGHSLCHKCLNTLFIPSEVSRNCPSCRGVIQKENCRPNFALISLLTGYQLPSASIPPYYLDGAKKVILQMRDQNEEMIRLIQWHIGTELEIKISASKSRITNLKEQLVDEENSLVELEASQNYPDVFSKEADSKETHLRDIRRVLDAFYFLRETQDLWKSIYEQPYIAENRRSSSEIEVSYDLVLLRKLISEIEDLPGWDSNESIREYYVSLLRLSYHYMFPLVNNKFDVWVMLETRMKQRQLNEDDGRLLICEKLCSMYPNKYISIHVNFGDGLRITKSGMDVSLRLHSSLKEIKKSIKHSIQIESNYNGPTYLFFGNCLLEDGKLSDLDLLESSNFYYSKFAMAIPRPGKGIDHLEYIDGAVAAINEKLPEIKMMMNALERKTRMAKFERAEAISIKLAASEVKRRDYKRRMSCNKYSPSNIAELLQKEEDFISSALQTRYFSLNSSYWYEDSPDSKSLRDLKELHDEIASRDYLSETKNLCWYIMIQRKKYFEDCKQSYNLESLRALEVEASSLPGWNVDESLKAYHFSLLKLAYHYLFPLLVDKFDIWALLLQRAKLRASNVFFDNGEILVCENLCALHADVLIQIRFDNGKVLEVKVHSPIDEVKQLAWDTFNVPIESQYLYFNGGEVENGKLLSDLDLLKSSIFFYCPRVIEIFVKSYTGKTITIEIDQAATIFNLKQSIEIVERLPVSQQRLIFESKLLEDDRPLLYYNIRNKCTCEAVLSMRGNDVFMMDITLLSNSPSGTPIYSLWYKSESPFGPLESEEIPLDLLKLGLDDALQPRSDGVLLVDYSKLAAPFNV